MRIFERPKYTGHRPLLVVAITAFLLLVFSPPVLAQSCVGDCNNDNEVTINELITGVNIALGNSLVETCPAFDVNDDGEVTINELISAVNNALNQCPPPAPTDTVEPSPTSTDTVEPTETETPAATSTPTPTVSVTTETPLLATETPTETPATPSAGLGERVFTIREDSQIGSLTVRTGFFSSGMGNASIANLFTAGPLTLVAGTPDADGIASVTLKEDAFYAVNLPPGGTTLCNHVIAAGSSGMIDCDGGTALGVRLVEPGGVTPPGTPETGLGADAGPGAVQLNVMQAVAEIENIAAPCNAETPGFADAIQAIYTTANYYAEKGIVSAEKDGENFSCDEWTTTDGPGMLVTGVVASDPRVPGGNVANITRLADM